MNTANSRSDAMLLDVTWSDGTKETFEMPGGLNPTARSQGITRAGSGVQNSACAG